MSNINMLVNSNNYSGLNDTRGNIYDWKDEYALYEKYKNLTMFSNDYRENHIPLDDESSSFIIGEYAKLEKDLQQLFFAQVLKKDPAIISPSYVRNAFQEDYRLFKNYHLWRDYWFKYKYKLDISLLKEISETSKISY